jgi:hypothetical protein
MRDNKKLVGTTLAVAAALTFASVPLTSVYAQGAQVQCFGINGCKGQSACKTANNACKANLRLQIALTLVEQPVKYSR